MQTPITQMATQPMPVGEEMITSIGLWPMPPEVGSTNHGSSQPSTSSRAPPAMISQTTALLSAARVCRAVSGRSMRACGSAMSGTGGHPHAEQAPGPQHPHGDQHGEDDRVAPLRPAQRRREHGGEPTDETSQARPPSRSRPPPYH